MSNKQPLYTVLLAPIVTEKTMSRTAEGTYTFRVRKDATKPEIKKAVEVFFKVAVDVVRTCVMKPEKTRFRQRLGQHSAWKKAYVQLAPGQVIEFSENK